ncbi:hypothetical protein K502DRAFT_353983 [Neoconidiobolus thromboides FSU 785]|nr:hypothetical protein K502DRAFT_353983 [Neoconidiobolus thromboides FSU 785]
MALIRVYGISTMNSSCKKTAFSSILCFIIFFCSIRILGILNNAHYSNFEIAPLLLNPSLENILSNEAKV